MVLAVLGLFCLGPIGGIAAVILGLVALREIKESHGAQGGQALAGVAVGLGALSTLAYAGGIVAAVWFAANSPSSTTTTAPTAYAPPVPVPTSTTPGPSPAVPKVTTAPGSEVASRDTTTTEFKLGAITLVDVGSDVSSLDSELRAQRAKASRNGEKLLIETTSSDCRPCFGVAAALVDKKMQKALEGVRLVRVDVMDFSDELRAAGIPHEAIPGFFLLGVDMSPVDGVNGGEWDDDVADNIAPVLSAFVRGKYTHRREPWGAQRREPVGGGTEL